MAREDWGPKAGYSILKFPASRVFFGFELSTQIIVRTAILECWTYNAILVWCYPARSLCSPGHALMIKSYSGSILPWEWRMPGRGGVP